MPRSFLTDSTKIHSPKKFSDEDSNDAGNIIEIDHNSPIDYPKALAFSLSSESDELTDSSFDTYDGSYFESSPEKSCSKISSFESIPDLPSSSSSSAKSLEFC